MPIEIVAADSPIIVALPYTGSNMPRIISSRLDDFEKSIEVPDKYLNRLIKDITGDANVLRANFHRYVSDVDFAPNLNGNRHHRGMIGVVPVLDRDGVALWQNPPSVGEAASWRASHYAPYHAALGACIARVKSKFGKAIVFNIRLQSAPLHKTAIRHDTGDLKICTHIGSACSVELATKLARMSDHDDSLHTILNGRADTGWTALHYGRAAMGVHAMDLQIDETCYLSKNHDDWHFDTEKASGIRALLREMFVFAANWSAA